MKYITRIVGLAIAVSVVLGCCVIPAFAVNVSYSGSYEYESSEYGKRLLQTELTGNQKQDVLAVALSQNGYHEGALGGNVISTSDLTEYNRWYYGSESEKVPWCATFVSFVFHHAGIPNETVPKFSGCSDAVSKLSSEEYGDGIWHDGYLNGGSYTPKQGDIVFFAWQEEVKFRPHTYYAVINGKSKGQVNHAGIVIEDGDGPRSLISTIEGNTKLCCKKGCGVKVCSRSPYDVVGYFTPNYKEASSSLGKLKVTFPENISNAWLNPDDPGNITWTPIEGADRYEYTVRSQLRNQDGSYREIDEWICSNVTTSDCSIPLKNNPEFSRSLREAEAFKVWIGAKNSDSKLIAETFVYIRMSDSKIDEDSMSDYNDTMPDYSYEIPKEEINGSTDKPSVQEGDEDPFPDEGYENAYGDSREDGDSKETESDDITQPNEDDDESIAILKRILYLLELLLTFFGISY